MYKSQPLLIDDARPLIAFLQRKEVLEGVDILSQVRWHIPSNMETLTFYFFAVSEELLNTVEDMFNIPLFEFEEEDKSEEFIKTLTILVTKEELRKNPVWGMHIEYAFPDMFFYLKYEDLKDVIYHTKTVRTDVIWVIVALLNQDRDLFNFCYKNAEKQLLDYGIDQRFALKYEYIRAYQDGGLINKLLNIDKTQLDRDYNLKDFAQTLNDNNFTYYKE